MPRPKSLISPVTKTMSLEEHHVRWIEQEARLRRVNGLSEMTRLILDFMISGLGHNGYKRFLTFVRGIDKERNRWKGDRTNP